jgi:hypothetical protein
LHPFDLPQDAPAAEVAPHAAPHLRAAKARRLTAETLSATVGALLLLMAVAATQAWMQRHFLPDLLFSLSRQLAVLSTCRLLAALAGLMLLDPGRVRLGRYFERTPVRRFVADAAPILIAAVSALAVTESVLRYVPALSAIDPVGEPLRRRDPVLGWAPVPNHAGRDTVAGRPIVYATDRAGFRVAPGAPPIDPAQPTILFVGESIMLGFGLNAEETIPAQVQAMTGVQSANLAVDGYATDQAYLRLRREWPRFKRPAAVVVLYTPEVFHRMLDVDRPHLDAGLVVRPAADQGRLMKVARWLVPYRTEPQIDHAAAVTREVLQATQRLAAERGAVTLVILPQFKPETPLERSLRRKILDEGHIPYVIASVPPEGRLRGDIHPNPRAAQAIAATAAAWLRSNGVGSLPG